MNTGMFTAEDLPHFDAAFLDMALQDVRHDHRTSTIDSDRRDRGGWTPREKRWTRAAREARAEGARREAAGLVNVPTSLQTQFSRTAEQSRDDAAVRHLGLRDDLGAFLVDPAKRRLAKLRMTIGYAARSHCVSERGHRTDVPWMVTLTYAPGREWAADHVSKAMQKCRHWCRKKGIPFRYVWIAEIQDGARRTDGIGRQMVHYHAVLWLPVGIKAPHFDRKGWWPHGMSRKDGPDDLAKRANNPVGYLLHYLKKDKDLSKMPKGARAYGVGGLEYSLRRAARWLRLPRFVQGNSSIYDNWRRAVGGGWVDPDGVLWRSEFQPIIVDSRRYITRVATHPVSIESSGPFSWLTDRTKAFTCSC